MPFEQTNPELGLYLSNNILTRAPGALFNLEHLTYLSLRNNEISELPPSVGKLRNLRELNLSLNRLRYLPGELLNLLEFPSALSSLHIHPNPFHRPQTLPSCPKPKRGSAAISNKHVPILRSEGSTSLVSLDNCQGEVANTTPVTAWRFVLLTRSAIQYSDSRGSVLSKFHLPDEELDNQFRSKASEEMQALTLETEDVSLLSTPPFQNRASGGNTKPSNVLSLFELASKSASRAAQIVSHSRRRLDSYTPKPMGFI